ncbi:1247_t:CDS:2 [Funneliformis geosporum]|nr:1247_t:CDS:2 [Funneliformis geosporum]
MCTPARERPLPSSSRTVGKCGSYTRKFGVRELLEDEYFMPVETRSPNQVSNNNHYKKKVMELCENCKACQIWPCELPLSPLKGVPLWRTPMSWYLNTSCKGKVGNS